jgi:RimJ/RimL family protein N-acetyltransferase
MLRGKNVLLRAIEREDLVLLHRYNNDLETEVLGGGDPPMPQALARLQADYEGNWSKGGRDGTSFAIEVEGQMIGQAALFQFDDVARTCAIGIAIGDKSFRGKGHGREVISLLLDYAFRHRNQNKVWLTVNGTNQQAIRAYRACGFVEEGRLRQHVWNNGAYIDFVYMGVLRSEWEGR